MVGVEVEQTLGHQRFDGDVRKAFAEIDEERRQERAELRRRRHAQTAARRDVAPPNRGVGVVEQLEDLREALAIKRAFFGRFDAARIAMQKPNSERLFDARDAPTDRGLALARQPRDRGERAQIDGQAEGAQVAKVGDRCFII